MCHGRGKTLGKTSSHGEEAAWNRLERGLGSWEDSWLATNNHKWDYFMSLSIKKYRIICHYSLYIVYITLRLKETQSSFISVSNRTNQHVEKERVNGTGDGSKFEIHRTTDFRPCLEFTIFGVPNFDSNPYPDAPCMEYLPTFGHFWGKMLVNIPYMEHVGYITTRCNKYNLNVAGDIWWVGNGMHNSWPSSCQEELLRAELVTVSPPRESNA